MSKISIPIKDEDIREIALVKRVMESCAMVPGFMERLDKNPREALDSIGIPLSERDLSFLPNTRTPEGNIQMHATYEGTAAAKYADFMQKKVESRDAIKEMCTPDNPAMKKWRNRQMNRIRTEIGAGSVGFVHSPLTFEIADGCSVGCEFCGLNAGRLKSVFRYTDENAELFRGVLQASKDIIGYAAGSGTMYFATEPLDNPDYELFLKDYREILVENPQITTARSTMHVERLKKLLKTVNEEKQIIYRFSVLSLDMLYQIYDAFTPEELVLVELLPQFPEAPNNHFTKVGKKGSEEEEYDSTISCVSGFVVNMVRKDVRLTTPCSADKDHPTGEIILERGTFTDAESYRELITGMIKRHMSNLISPSDKLTLGKNITVKIQDDGKLAIDIKKEVMLIYDCKDFADMFIALFDKLKDKEMTRQELVTDLRKDEKYNIFTPELICYMVNRFWNAGYLRIVSGKV
ncbi:MAG: radical SAM family RiPP maturation amino acid epimerase [Lachnospiraceae bacterium]|nr:radical SAM family RiPP maturation amino acid epimerase [Lachnospiraceae bacterium]